MKERPILFSAPMVRAILEGRKTQTRRVIKPQPDAVHDGEPYWYIGGYRAWEHRGITDPLRMGTHNPIACPYGAAGDRLWVREAWALVPKTAYCQSVGVDQINKPNCNHDAAVFRAGWERSPPSRWRPSIHMPRWASRITLEIVSVRVERLNEISEQDALAEGCRPIEGCKWHTFEEADAGIPMHDHTALDSFEALWECINGAGSWQQNPWVWVVEFKRVESKREN